MPPANKYINANADPKTFKSQRSMATDEINQRKDIYNQGFNRLDGIHPHPLKVDPQTGTDSNVILNIFEIIVDRTIAFTFGEFPEIDVDKLGEKSDQNSDNDVETYLEACWEQSDDLDFLQNEAVYGVLGGHCFARIIPADSQHEYARIVVVDAASMIVFWKADDISTVMWYEQRFSIGSENHRIDYINNVACDSGDNWSIVEYVQRGQNWVVVATEEWKYPLSPIVDWQHFKDPRFYYGRRELRNISLQDAVNKVASDVRSILRNHASPKTIGTGFNANTLTPTAIGGLWAINEPNARVTNLEMNSDLKSSMEFLALLKNALFSENRVVNIEGGPDVYRGLTNLAIRSIFKDFQTKINQLQRAYGRALVEISKRFLMLDGREWKNLKFNLVWLPSIPTSKLEEAQIVQLERGLNLLSMRTASQELDLDYEKEQEQIKAEPDPEMTRLAKYTNGGDPLTAGAINGIDKQG